MLTYLFNAWLFWNRHMKFYCSNFCPKRKDFRQLRCLSLFQYFLLMHDRWQFSTYCSSLCHVFVFNYLIYSLNLFNFCREICKSAPKSKRMIFYAAGPQFVSTLTFSFKGLRNTLSLSRHLLSEIACKQTKESNEQK